MALEKDPDANLDFDVDWSGWLVPGDTIATSTWVDVTPGITVTDDTQHTGTRGIIWLAGGTIGTVYQATNRITTVEGRGDDRTISVLVIEPVTSPPDLPDECWPADFTTIAAEWNALDEDSLPVYTVEVKARAVALAGQTLRLLTGYRVGGCPITVRPCRRECNEREWHTYDVTGFPGSTPWWPVGLGGQWLPIGCGCSGGCSCSRTSEVRLPNTAGQVTQVLIDGTPLDEGTGWRFDPGGRLYRVDGELWPLCQDLNAPDTEPGTWSVTYTPGAPVDGLGALACALLALAYAKALNGADDCGLPSNVVTVTRLGVQMTLAPGSFPEGRTGIRLVDDYITRWNPYGHLGTPMAVFSLDRPMPRPTGRG